MVIFKAEIYNGRNIGQGFLHKKGVQIVAYDSETGKRRYYFNSTGFSSPCKKLWEGVYHYKSGFNKVDEESFWMALSEAKNKVDRLNILRQQVEEEVIKCRVMK